MAKHTSAERAISYVGLCHVGATPRLVKPAVGVAKVLPWPLLKLGCFSVILIAFDHRKCKGRPKESLGDTSGNRSAAN